jgi:hypothetical protein
VLQCATGVRNVEKANFSNNNMRVEGGQWSVCVGAEKVGETRVGERLGLIRTLLT